MARHGGRKTPAERKELHEVGSVVGLATQIRPKHMQYQYVMMVSWRATPDEDEHYEIIITI